MGVLGKMKFKDYVKQLNEFLKKNPETAEYETYSAEDPEGNGFYNVYAGPAAYYAPDAGDYNISEVYENIDDYIECCIDEDEVEEVVFEPNIVIVAP